VLTLLKYYFQIVIIKEVIIKNNFGQFCVPPFYVSQVSTIQIYSIVFIEALQARLMDEESERKE